MIRRGLAATAFAILVAVVTTTPALASGPTPNTTGWDISWPQCPSNFPPTTGFGIVGVNGGKAWTSNPCLSAEYQWMTKTTQASTSTSFYINTGNPGTKSTHWGLPGPKTCVNPQLHRSVNDAGCAYNYGWNAAGDAFSHAAGVTSSAQTASWWLDVETANSWDGTGAANSADIQGGIDYLKTQQGVATVGVYSTGYQWNQITGGYRIPNPNWVAGAQTLQQAQQFCSGTSFTGGPVALTQYPSGAFDGDYACP